jgi:hypothetical protein
MTKNVAAAEHHSWLTVISSKHCQLRKPAREEAFLPIIFVLIFFGNLTRTNMVGETS